MRGNQLGNLNYKQGRFMKYLVLASVLLTSGCASLTQGTSQVLTFSIEPKSARCDVNRTGDGILGQVSQSSNTIEVGKDKDDIIIQCKADGYTPQVTRLKSSASGAGVSGAIFIDLGITDMVTGAMWVYPNHTSIILKKETDAS